MSDVTLGSMMKKKRVKKSPHMTEATHPGVDAVRNKIIDNQKAFETGKIDRDTFKKIEKDLMAQFKAIQGK